MVLTLFYAPKEMGSVVWDLGKVFGGRRGVSSLRDGLICTSLLQAF